MRVKRESGENVVAWNHSTRCRQYILSRYKQTQHLDVIMLPDCQQLKTKVGT